VVKKRPIRVRPSTSTSTPVADLRLLRQCIHELQALYTEAVRILDRLLTGASTEIVSDLCARFHVLQEYFAMRYQEAKAHAINVLGHVEAALSFP
jgi:hypothetical protein